jgi:hypothetical protein
VIVSARDHHAAVIKPTIIPNTVINVAPLTSREIPPFVVAPESLVAVELDPVPVPLAAADVDVVAFAANWAPMANASALKLAKELLLPSAPGLTANTMPLPQWLAAVFAAWRQCIQMGFV